MPELFDLEKMRAEIKEDEEFELSLRQGPVSQEDIQKMVQSRIQKAREKS